MAKRYFMQMVTRRELGWLYLYKIVFKSKLSQETRTLYNNKKVTSPGRYNKYKYIRTQHQSVQTYEANIDDTNGEIGSNTIIIDFRTPLSIIDKQTDH